MLAVYNLMSIRPVVVDSIVIDYGCFHLRLPYTIS